MSGTFYEFFAGAGMARAGLGDRWRCLFANDIDLKKAGTYDDNWGAGAMKPADVKTLKPTDLPGEADLVWASFPCQDLSLAGGGAGLRGERSGVFWPFWRLIAQLNEEGRGPPIVALENVAATLTSHSGKDFEALCLALVDAGYKVGARVIDAVLFVPQSRPRMFLIAVRDDVTIPAGLVEPSGSLAGVDSRVAATYDRIVSRVVDEPELQRVVDAWINWSVPLPSTKRAGLAEIIEDEPEGVEWHSQDETKTLIDRMSDINRRKVIKASKAGARMFGTAYRRTRVHKGVKTVRTEVRFDGIAGCLRTPSGGSSRQIVIEVKGRRVRSRLMSSREAARLMGMSDKYKLPSAYNEAYHLIGDGVAVPVVDHLARNIFDPLMAAMRCNLRLVA
ncbi:MAG: DNA cytosine methyltransferase [Erythrobacter sp.]|nr:DNA cytosine methyltransferase [Erythrobacter sp.]